MILSVFHNLFKESIQIIMSESLKNWAQIGLLLCSHLPFAKVIICSVHANEANINLNVSYYALDVSVFETLALMWVGREREMRQRRSVGGG